MKLLVNRLDLQSYHTCSEPGCRERHPGTDSPPVVQVLQRPVAQTLAPAAMIVAASADTAKPPAPTPQAPKGLSRKDMESVRKAVDQAAQKTMVQQVAKLSGAFGKIKSGENPSKPKTQYEEFIESLNANPDTKDLSKSKKDDMWKDHKLSALIRDAVTKGRQGLGVSGPTIDLNRCTLTELKRIPSLSQEMGKQIIHLRQSKAQGFSSWREIRDIKGIGEGLFSQIVIFCMDPSTIPLPVEVLTPEAIEEPAPAAASGSETLPNLIAESTSNPQTYNSGPEVSTDSDREPRVAVNLTGVILAMEATPGEQSQRWNETFLAAESDLKPGFFMLDSGCFRSIWRCTYSCKCVCTSPTVWTQTVECTQSRGVRFRKLQH